MKTARILIILVLVATAMAFIGAIPRHVVDPTWPPHARNHALQSLFWIVGFCVVGVLIAKGPLARRESWALWALGLTGVFVFGGYFLPVVLTGGGAPGPLDDAFFGVLCVVYAASLVRASSGSAA